MRAIITKGGFPTFINIRENEFINQYLVTLNYLKKQTCLNVSNILHKP
jgi:hypothetical protein